MKNYNLIIVSILSLFLIIGCAGVPNIVKIDNTITSNSAYNVITSVELSNHELMTIEHARNNYLSLRNKWKEKIKIEGFEQIFLESRDLQHDYELLVDQYNLIFNIVDNNKEKYKPEDLEKLSEISKEFVKFYNSVETLEDVNYASKVFVKLLSIIATVFIK